MDIKIHGLTRPIIEEAIAKTRKARLYIIDEVMNKAIDAPRAEVGEFAPKIIQMQIDPQKIGDVVGQRGKTINAIIEQTGVKIDITDDGAVSICGTDAKGMEEAQKMITSSSQILRPDRFWKEKLSASKTSVHSLSSHLEKKEWYTFLSFPKKE